VPFTPFGGRPSPESDTAALECGGHVAGQRRGWRGRVLTSRDPARIEARFPRSWETPFPAGGTGRLGYDLAPQDQVVVGLKVAVPRGAKAGSTIRLHLAQRNLSARRIDGGVAVEIHVRT
jgi:hypothetical protein